MPTPSPAIITILTEFATAFTAPTFRKVLVLVYGTILAPGRRTVAAALRAMGLADTPHFTNYHRVLNRAQWSTWVVSKLLLRLIIRLCLTEREALLLVIDETLERRQGPTIRYIAWFRDPLRSTAKRVSHALGIRWICLTVLVRVPWSQRPWALPFMTLPALSPTVSKRLGKPHRTLVEWADLMIQRVRRWQPEREIVLVGDGSYAAVVLVQRCQRLKRPVALVSRLRLDARLFDPPSPQPPSKRGPKPKKGARQSKLYERLVDPDTVWQTLPLPWYGTRKTVAYCTGTALWHVTGHDPVPIRWVLVRCPDDSFPPRALFCSDPTCSYLRILLLALARWNIEVTFQELRAHLGFETQRQWSQRAIERTTPCLFGLFSLVVLLARTLYPTTLPIRTAAWYHKEQATFCDALAVVRRDLLALPNYTTSSADPDPVLIPRPLATILLDLASYSA